MPDLKTSEYPVETIVLANGDLFDVSKKISSSPDVYESEKVDYATLRAAVSSVTIYSGNGSLSGNRTLNLAGYTFTFGDSAIADSFQLNLKETVNDPLVFFIKNASSGANASSQILFANDTGDVGGMGATGSAFVFNNFLPDALYIGTGGAKPIFFATTSSAHTIVSASGNWGFGIIDSAAVAYARVCISNSGVGYGLGITVDGTDSGDGLLFRAEAGKARILANNNIPLIIEQNTSQITKFYNDGTNIYIGIGFNSNSNPTAFLGSDVNSIGYIQLNDTNDITKVQIHPASGQVTYFTGQSFLGIGTNTPLDSLDIASPDGKGITLRMPNYGDYNYIKWKNGSNLNTNSISSDTDWMTIKNPTGGLFLQNSGGFPAMAFVSAGGGYFRLDSLGATALDPLRSSSYITFDARYFDGVTEVGNAATLRNTAIDMAGNFRFNLGHNLVNVVTIGTALQGLAIGGFEFGANARNTLAISNGTTSPTTSIADGIQLFSKNSSDATATLGMYLEQAIEAGVGISSTNKVKVLINGTEWYIGLTAV